MPFIAVLNCKTVAIRQDEVAYSRPPGQSSQRHARVILEAKPLGTDFDSGPSRSELLNANSNVTYRITSRLGPTHSGY